MVKSDGNGAVRKRACHQAPMAVCQKFSAQWRNEYARLGGGRGLHLCDPPPTWLIVHRLIVQVRAPSCAWQNDIPPSPPLASPCRHGFDDVKQGNLFLSIADILDVHRPVA